MDRVNRRRSRTDRSGPYSRPDKSASHHSIYTRRCAGKAERVSSGCRLAHLLAKIRHSALCSSVHEWFGVLRGKPNELRRWLTSGRLDPNTDIYDVFEGEWVNVSVLKPLMTPPSSQASGCLSIIALFLR